MARYLKVAQEANEIARLILTFVDDLDNSPQVAELIARLFNLGVRVSPRGVQHTVRFNAVREAVKGLPVTVGMVEKKDERTGRTYHALTTKPYKSDKHQHVVETIEGADNEE